LTTPTQPISRYLPTILSSSSSSSSFPPPLFGLPEDSNFLIEKKPPLPQWKITKFFYLRVLLMCFVSYAHTSFQVSPRYSALSDFLIYYLVLLA
jgi:hypothetical protein